MDELGRHLGKLFLLFGGFFLLVGLLLTAGSHLPLGLGRLPGDITIRRDNFTLYLPLATCLLLSGLVSLIFWLFGRLRP